MKQNQRIIKNIAVLLPSQLVGYGLNIFIVVVIARYLGAEGFGHYSFIVAFIGIFQLIADSGLANIMIREISVDSANLKFQLGVTKSLIWVLSIAAFIMIFVIINIIDPAVDIKYATYIMSIAMLATIHTIGYTSVFKAMEKMEYNAAGFVLHKFILLGLIFTVIWLKIGLIGVASAYLLSNLLLWMFYYLIVCKKYFKPEMAIDLKTWWFFISESIPIGIGGILRRSTWQVDILILTAIAPVLSVGLFSAPYKIISSLIVLPQSFAIIFFPLFSRLAKTSQDELSSIYQKTLKLMFFLGVPIVVVLAVLAQDIMLLFFGVNFADSYIALQILSFSLLFLFPASQFLYIFSALGRQRFFTFIALICISVNIILDLILIPKYDFIGASIGTLISDMIFFAVGGYYIKLFVKDISFIRVSWKQLLSGVLMAFVLFNFKDSSIFLMVVGVFVGLIAYAVSSIVLKTFSKGEVEAVRKNLKFNKGIQVI